MKILMVVANFAPEIGSAAHVYYDLARAFVKKGHNVHVLTSYPREFNLDESDQGKEFLYHEKMDGIEIHRSKHFAMRDFPLFRGLEHFILPCQYFSQYKKIDEDFDVCLMYIPPLPLYQLADKIKKYDGTPSVLNYQDFHPQELIDVNYGGIKKNYIMIKLLEHMERKSYRGADYITVLSKGGIRYVVDRGADPHKVTHIYNGTNLDHMEKFRNKKDFKEKEGIEDRFLVSYAGILSPFQGIDNILNVALELKDHQDIIFYIAGDGMIKDDLERRVKEEDMSNVKILPFLPRDEYFNLINSSNISIVSLDKRMKAPCLPGKMTNLLAMGQTIVGIVPKDSESAKTIQRAKSGLFVEPGDNESLKNAILDLKNDKDLKQKIENSERSFFIQNMDLEKNVEIYLEIFNSLIS